MSGSWRWRPASAILAVALTVVTGCDSSVPEDVTSRNERLASELEQGLRQDLGVREVTVTYLDNPSFYRSVNIDVECTQCRPRSLAKEASAAAWRSEVEPMAWLDVRVVVTDDPERTHHESYDLEDPEVYARLEREYGPRPVEPYEE